MSVAARFGGKAARCVAFLSRVNAPAFLENSKRKTPGPGRARCAEGAFGVFHNRCSTSPAAVINSSGHDAHSGAEYSLIS